MTPSPVDAQRHQRGHCGCATSNHRGSSLTLQVVLTTPQRPGRAGAHRHPGAHRGHVGRRLSLDLRLAASCSGCGGGARYRAARRVVTPDEPCASHGTPRASSRWRAARWSLASPACCASWCSPGCSASRRSPTPSTSPTPCPTCSSTSCSAASPAATFIPVFVERLALDGERRAWKSISSVVTGALIVLVARVGPRVVLAPRGSSTASPSSNRSTVDAFAEHASLSSAPSRRHCCAGSFPRSSSTASSASRRRCSTSADASASRPWVPIANNARVHRASSSGSTSSTPRRARHSLQRLARPALARARHDGRASPCSSSASCPRSPAATSGALRFASISRTPPCARSAASAAGRCSSCSPTSSRSTSCLAFAFGIGGNGPVSAYTYGWSFMQMPYAVVVVSVLGALTPAAGGSRDQARTSRGWANGCASVFASRSSSSFPARWCSSSSPNRSSASCSTT